jgi:hypothetical protein
LSIRVGLDLNWILGIMGPFYLGNAVVLELEYLHAVEERRVDEGVEARDLVLVYVEGVKVGVGRVSVEASQVRDPIPVDDEDDGEWGNGWKAGKVLGRAVGTESEGHLPVHRLMDYGVVR